MSKDELLSHFYETPSLWGECQNTPCSGFAKGQRFLNMVMTFVLTPSSYYNSIIEPRVRFLLSLLEDLSIDFPSHFIIFIIDVYRDMATCDSSFFLWLSYGSFTILLSIFLILLSRLSWVPLVRHLFDEVRPSFNQSSHRPRRRLL